MRRPVLRAPLSPFGTSRPDFPGDARRGAGRVPAGGARRALGAHALVLRTAGAHGAACLRAAARAMSAQRIIHDARPAARERILNVPAVMVALLAVLGLVHAVLALVLTERQTNDALLLFAFIPARYDPEPAAGRGMAGRIRRRHLDVRHLRADLTAISVIWSSIRCGCWPSARRWRAGSGRGASLYSSRSTAAGGAAVHLATHFGELLPMIGASAAISGAMAAAMRFAFQRGGPLGAVARSAPTLIGCPAVPLMAMPARSARAGIPAGVVRRECADRARLVRDAGHGTGGRLAGAYRRFRRRALGICAASIRFRRASTPAMATIRSLRLRGD